MNRNTSFEIVMSIDYKKVFEAILIHFQPEGASIQCREDAELSLRT